MKFIKGEFGVLPDYPWRSYPSYSVFRHKDNRKWFSVLMRIDKAKLDRSKNGMVYVINVKCDPFLIRHYHQSLGIYPAYHMHKGSWVSIVLSEREDDELIKKMIKDSFNLTSSGI